MSIYVFIYGNPTRGRNHDSACYASAARLASPNDGRAPRRLGMLVDFGQYGADPRG